MTYGLTSAGFVCPTLDNLKSDLQAAYTAIYGTPNLADDSVIGIRIGIMAKALVDSWQALQGAYNAPFPSLGDDSSFPGIMDINGLKMLPASQSVVTCQCVGTSSTVIPAGSQVKSTNGDLFELVTQITVPVGGSIDGTFQAIGTGAIPVVANTVTSIQTPISGWTSVNNSAAGTTGNPAESVTDARIRRKGSLQVVGAGVLDAIVARLEQEVPGVTIVTGYENDLDVTVNGRGPHTMEFVVSGSALDQDVANKLWQVRGGGIELLGTTSVTVVDSKGRNQTVKFTKPAAVPCSVEVTITDFAEEVLPSDYANAIKIAVAAYGAELPIGKDLVIGRWVIPVYSIPGINVVTIRQKKNGGSFGTTNIVMAYNEQPTFQVSDITVIGP